MMNRPQNLSLATNPKTSTPNPNHKIMIQNPREKFAWDESSYSPLCHVHTQFMLPCMKKPDVTILSHVIKHSRLSPILRTQLSHN